MARRDLKEAGKALATKQDAGVKATQDVFDTHGNDAIKDHINEAQQADPAKAQASVLDAAAQSAEAQVDPAARGAAMDEVTTLMYKLESSPAVLTELVAGKDSAEDKVTALLHYMGTQLSTGAVDALATMSIDEIAFDLGNLVISTAALQVVDMSPEIEKLGAMAPILFDVLVGYVDRFSPEGVVANEEVSEEEADAAAMIAALGETEQMLQFL